MDGTESVIATNMVTDGSHLTTVPLASVFITLQIIQNVLSTLSTQESFPAKKEEMMVRSIMLKRKTYKQQT